MFKNKLLPVLALVLCAAMLLSACSAKPEAEEPKDSENVETVEPETTEPEVQADTTAPVVTPETVELTAGAEMTDLLAVLTATDDMDGAISLTADMISGEYDLATAGSYTITVTAADSAGNTSETPVALTVVEADA